ncbi:MULTISPECIES: hypothetical protein [Leptolyngbya]|uniref:hypothetical protein n=1 Tax=Leptolyngbya TaxID=47251 RepID=UPI001685D1E4|nr:MULTISPECIES: hypothetical protein [unclassified Leptolyngbya]MBD1854676.1 hypothetical protein [Leptolyngbya sp. FACHB-1624]MCY6492676.1 hypothetical protein [Leptolyngbya sp. GGD]
MKLRWKTLFVQVAIWAVSEVALTCVGIDDLADYSEFILDRKQAFIEAISKSTPFATAPFPFCPKVSVLIA